MHRFFRRLLAVLFLTASLAGAASAAEIKTETLRIRGNVPHGAMDVTVELPSGGQTRSAALIRARLIREVDQFLAGLFAEEDTRAFPPYGGSKEDTVALAGYYRSSTLLVVSASPRWIPAVKNGARVPVTVTFPVIFQLR